MADRLSCARRVIRAEAAALEAVAGRLGPSFDRAVEAVLGCASRVVVTGMGKAGFVAQRLSATLAGTGTPSLYLHPAEAYHGDLGRVVPSDVVLVLSNSGETEEIVRLLPLLKRVGAKIVAVTGRAESSLGRTADITVEIGDVPEADPVGLAPSASAAVLAAVGDALALTVQAERGFGPEEFALYHPGGELGRRLMKVGDIMRTGERHAKVREGATVGEAILEITRARSGAASVLDAGGKLAGIFTDGDLRRTVTRDPAALQRPVRDVMTRTPATIGPDRLVTEAARLFQERRVDEIPVVDAEGRAVGVLDIQDLLGARYL